MFMLYKTLNQKFYINKLKISKERALIMLTGYLTQAPYNRLKTTFSNVASSKLK